MATSSCKHKWIIATVGFDVDPDKHGTGTWLEIKKGQKYCLHCYKLHDGTKAVDAPKAAPVVCNVTIDRPAEKVPASTSKKPSQKASEGLSGGSKPARAPVATPPRIPRPKPVVTKRAPVFVSMDDDDEL